MGQIILIILLVIGILGFFISLLILIMAICSMKDTFKKKPKNNRRV